ncbi:hypothetical protein NDU88_005173 [Pleurodeles waltl]|uniref:Uncharacterized protein n=1 Tax=Pleurodeles waltl TaxID=8319 RepID=A0AAV7VKW4_PLEWA|nr:hypothetical protein NDU88_005173 [Pleurodeles waltl]
MAVEDHRNKVSDRDRELLYLRDKIMDLEDKGPRDNVRFFGLPEHAEGADVKGFIPLLTKLDFTPLPELQRAHHLGPACLATLEHPLTIIACFFHQQQVRQLLSTARSHGPYDHEGHIIHITADLSKEANDQRKAFLALQLQLCKIYIKFGLFEPGRMWIIKDDFYDLDALGLFLDGMTKRDMDLTSLDSEPVPHPASSPPPGSVRGDQWRTEHTTGVGILRDQPDRNMALKAVVDITSIHNRDKSQSWL